MHDVAPSGARGGPAGRRRVCAARGRIRGRRTAALNRAPRAAARLLAVFSTAVAAAILFAGAATAAAAPTGPVVRLTGAITPALATAARDRGTALAPRRQLQLTVTLQPRDPAALSAYARAVSTPGSAAYRHYLTPARFGRRFGADAAQVRRVRAAFAQRGLRLGALSAGRLSIPLRARAATIERGLDVQLRTLQQRGRETIAATRAPALAAGAAGDVQSIVGLDSSASPRPLITRPRRLGPLRKPPTVDAAATDATAPASVAGRSGAEALLGRERRRRQPRWLHRPAAGLRIRIRRPLQGRRHGRRDDNRGLRARARRSRGHHRLRGLLRDPPEYFLRPRRRRRGPRRRQRRGRVRHRERDRVRAGREGARLPGPELEFDRPGIRPVRHVREDRQPGPRPGRLGLVGSL